MRIVHDEQDLVQFVREAVHVAPEHPILIDKFLEDALEIDVDAVSDGERVVVGGVMEHIEKAGIHSGDAACASSDVTSRPNSESPAQASARNAGRSAGARSRTASNTSSTFFQRSGFKSFEPTS